MTVDPIERGAPAAPMPQARPRRPLLLLAVRFQSLLGLVLVVVGGIIF